MSAPVRELLDSFEALSETDKHQAAVEILRRYPAPADGDLSETALVEIVDELFRALDAEEANRAKR